MNYNFYINAKIEPASSIYNKTYTLKMSCVDGSIGVNSGIKSLYVCYGTSGNTTQCGATGCATVSCTGSDQVTWQNVASYSGCSSAPQFSAPIRVSCSGPSEMGEDGDIITCGGKKLKLNISQL